MLKKKSILLNLILDCTVICKTAKDASFLSLRQSTAQHFSIFFILAWATKTPVVPWSSYVSRLIAAGPRGWKEIRHHLLTKTFFTNRTCTALLPIIYFYPTIKFSLMGGHCITLQGLGSTNLDCCGKRGRKEMVDWWM